MAWGLPVVALCLWLGGWVLAAAVAALAAACLREFWPLGRTFGVEGGPRAELALGAGLLLLGASLGQRPFAVALPAALVFVWLGGVVRAAATADVRRLRSTLAGTIWATLGLLYIPLLLGYLLRLRDSGPLALFHTLLFVTIIWVADVVAFLAGSTLGRHSLAPGISPGKTVEGAVAAMAMAALCGAIAAGLVAGVGALGGAGLGAVLAALGLLGDLWESVLKRGAGVKDSGAAVPGHGGVLDRFDSLLLAAPGAYWLLVALPWGHALH